jgi:hypothetical protein
MKSAIKTFLVVVAIATTTHIAIAQTPYDDFEPSNKKKEMLKLPEATFKAFNIDTTSNLKYIELDKETGVLSYFGKNDTLLFAMVLSPNESKWWSVDPKAAKYPEASPYNFVNNNPIRNIDPDGQDWFEYQKEGSKEKSWNWQDGSTYNHKTGVDADGKDVFQSLTGQKAVVVFNGSRNEKLGEGQNLFGKGAVLASVTVYGPKGADDVQQYQGFSMSSDFSKYGAIDNGDYNVNYRNPGKTGALKSNWAVNNTRPVNTLDNNNPSPIDPYSSTQKDGIYIHRSNNNGYAGGTVSTGCLLIVPTQYDIKGQATNMGWDQFNQQLQGVNQFRLQINGR